MQITLNQVEIEEAITNYVNDLVSVNEGMAITVTIKATRGEEGTTALIDIIPKVAEPEEVEPEVVEPVKAAARPARKPAVKQAVAPDKEESVAETQPEPEPVTEEEAAPDAAEVPVADEEQAEVPAVAAPKSLFANLRKPNNG